jgi:leucyl aminopeptidase
MTAPGPRTKIEITPYASQNADTLLLTVAAGGKLGPEGQALDRKWNGWLTHCLKWANRGFAGKRGETLVLPAQPNGPFRNIVLLGIGNAKALDRKGCELLGGPASKALAEIGAASATLSVDAHADLPLAQEEASAWLGNAALRASYDFTKYKSESGQPSLKTLWLYAAKDPTKARVAAMKQEAVNRGTWWAADLANEPGNALYPDSYAKEIEARLAPLGVKVTILDEHDMAKLGMGAALAVGRGSAKPPRMVVMEYDGTNGAQKRPLSLVGKGMTFDSGGISIKPGDGMQEMKFDMCGSAAVVGAMYALAARKARTKVVSIVALAENMPGGNAVKPGDIVASMSGKTVEVVDTDAEGRLVLADALTYVQRAYNPHTVIDLATLTGAIGTALGRTYTGVFANDDRLWKRLDKAGCAVNEPGWRMPLHEDFAEAMAGDFADLINYSKSEAGACTAAAFLHQFIEKDKNGADKCKWAHMDVAYTAMPASGPAHGYGVQLLDRLVADNYEQRDPYAYKPLHAPKKPKP